MRNTLLTIIITVITVVGVLGIAAEAANKTTLKVVTTLPDYAFLAEAIGGDRISVTAIVRGDQDAHFIRPKPSFSMAVRKADVLVSTGLDLELWLQTVIDNSGNRKIRSGQSGYVSASYGMNLLEKPKVMSRAEGGLHIYGNPHVTCSPINMKVAARNIATGLIKNDPAGKQIYQENLKKLEQEIDEHLFGIKLVQMLGGETLCSLAEQGKITGFLGEHEFEGKPLIEYLGGWIKKMLPLKGLSVVSYHKNWIYFARLFGLEEAGYVEPKPGIPPSPKHVTELVNMMREKDVRIILAANYFDEQKIRTVAGRVGAEPVIVPLYVGGAPGTDDYFQLVNLWVNRLLEAAKKKNVLDVEDK
ncbi:MAG TPA: zinc ABC transporter substrate-binding protein [Planctomycetes bacterium]|nr:zinc ABC transporter substrate-binding protein [Planctomycetota bacterium]HIJ71990.1 zinc ABC transporter substrate-binding protein [Planctomycetota bacterium]